MISIEPSVLAIPVITPFSSMVTLFVSVEIYVILSLVL